MVSFDIMDYIEPSLESTTSPAAGIPMQETPDITVPDEVTTLEFIRLALEVEAWRRQTWVLSVFSVVESTDDDSNWIVQRDDKGFFFEVNGNVHRITDTKPEPNEPLLKFRGNVIIPKGYLPNVKAETKTVWGNVVLWNALLCWAFGKKVDFITGRISAKQLEKIILERLADDPETYDPEVHRNDHEHIYITEYQNFVAGAMYFTAFNSIATPTATPKSLSKHPDTAKLKAKLLEENKDTLDDAATVAKIEGELMKLDDEYLKGDRSEDYFIFKKTRKVARKKMKLMHGAESAFRTDGKVTTVPNSLDEGWDPKYLPEMASSGRSGSYARGKETALGGESVKFFYRGFQNATVLEDDCGTKDGYHRYVTEQNYDLLVGYYIIERGVTVHIDTAKKALSYVGDVVELRTPGYCLTEGSSFCKRCLGDVNSSSKNGLMQLGADVGSQFMGIRMSAMHGKELAVAEFTLNHFV